MSMIGKTLSHYEITSQLGKGGMGEVYQAKDQKLGRDVAIKVLPEEFAKDADRVARFQREAKLLASLNHTNIAAIYGLEASDQTNFLVLELVEGETLADQIKRGAIPVEESLKLALQIAEALEAAHEKGVIHRDLKPANIKVTPDGKVKVLDFGLAKAFAGEQADLNLSNSPTLSNAATQQGVILGTAAYMSPEQARGKIVDKRTDIWAFGCVLFEMLTGHAAFSGRDVTDILAAVIRAEPEWNNLPVNLHWRLREMLERCLEKDSKDRYHDISDVRVDIKKVLADPSSVLAQPITTVGSRTRMRQILPWVAGTAVLVAIITGLAVWNLKPPEPRHIVRFDWELPAGQQFNSLNTIALAVSSDGSQFVYGTKEGLYLRSLEQPAGRLIPGTDENSQFPIFSPDGKWICYWSAASNQLKKIAVSGGAPIMLCNAQVPRQPTWDLDDAIVYAQTEGIMRISSNGGTPELIVKAEGRAIGGPQLLPDGKTVLFHVGLTRETRKVMVQSLKSGERKELFEGSNARYLPTGNIVYALGNNIFAIAFDLGKLGVIGGPVSMVESVSSGRLTLHYAISVSGTLVYVPALTNAAMLGRTLVWVDRKGQEEPLTATPDAYDFPRISPDGTRVALTAGAYPDMNIWIWDTVRKALTRLTFDAPTNLVPLWTSDGKRIAFVSIPDPQHAGVYWKAADGTGKDELLVSEPGALLSPWSWADNGKTLVLQKTEFSFVSYDIAMLPLEGGRKWKPLLQEKYAERQPRISPNGRWMAYMSDESGKDEVYVRPFPDVEGGRWQASTGGGDSPLWSPDGRELFYRNGDAVMTVPVKTDPSYSQETPKTLFHGIYLGGTVTNSALGRRWDIGPDGKRFLMIKEPGSAASAGGGPRKINIVLNWLEELKQRVPTK
jgi:eukaryotic-like serine/threonine-protein kinase